MVATRRLLVVSSTSPVISPCDDHVLYRHPPSLVSSTDARGFLAMAGDDTHPPVEALDDVRGITAFQKRDAVAPTGRKYPIARRLHDRRIRIAQQFRVAKRE